MNNNINRDRLERFRQLQQGISNQAPTLPGAQKPNQANVISYNNKVLGGNVTTAPSKGSGTDATGANNASGGSASAGGSNKSTGVSKGNISDGGNGKAGNITGNYQNYADQVFDGLGITGGNPYTFDPTTDPAYQAAIDALARAQKNAPTYAGTYDADLENLYNEIVNRDKFSYDLNSDMLYQQYKDQYTNMGQMAMMDTMGQAAALTGGYGSSYGQAVGQQQYNAYLQQLNDVVPELYGMALDQYNQEGQNLLNQYSMLGDLRDTEYGRYRDDVSDYWTNVNFYDEQADQQYDRGYQNWYNSYIMKRDEEETQYNRQWNEDERDYNRKQDSITQQNANRDYLITLITNTGYKPTDDELAAAGMTRAQANAYKKLYTGGSTKKTTGGTGGSNYTYNPPSKDTKEVEEPKKTPTETFTGSTFNDAYNYLKGIGMNISQDWLSHYIMSTTDWINSGRSTSETYADYVRSTVQYIVNQFGG